jgi:hypothetical protein
MAKKKGSGGSKPTTASETSRPLPQGSMGLNMTPAGGGSAFPAFMAGTLLAGEADTSDDLGGLAPTFGNVLNSIGVGVATSQEALDKGLVEIAKSLSDTNIDLVTQVIQELDDDGLPVAPTDDSNLRKQNVSLINFVNPQAHEWKHVALSMDMSVGEIDNETGMTYNATQTNSSASTTGLLWGFVGWFQHSHTNRETSVERSTDQEAGWAQGQVRMDAMLAPRRTGKFPVPAEVSIGPQIAIGMGGVIESENAGVITRSQDLTITVRKADGSVNPDVPLIISSSSFAIELLDNSAASFNFTNTDGIVMARVKRRIPNAIFGRALRGTVTVELGQISKDIEINI